MNYLSRAIIDKDLKIKNILIKSKFSLNAKNTTLVFKAWECFNAYFSLTRNLLSFVEILIRTYWITVFVITDVNSVRLSRRRRGRKSRRKSNVLKREVGRPLVRVVAGRREVEPDAAGRHCNDVQALRLRQRDARDADDREEVWLVDVPVNKNKTDIYYTK